MNRIRPLVFSSLIIVSLLLLTIGEVNAIEIKAATVIPEGAPGYAQLQNSLMEIQKQTGGEIVIKLYGGGVAGDETDVLRKMRANRIDMAQFSGVGMGMIYPEIRVIESPGLFQSYEEADYVYDRLFDYFSPRLEEKGFVLLGLSEAGFIYLFSKQDMTTPKGLDGLKMWTWKGDPVSGITMEMLSLQVTPLHISDVNVGLQTGMIDSFYAFPLAATSFQWYSSINYMLDYKVTRALGCYVMTTGAFRKVPKKEHQDIIRDVFKAFALETNRITRKANEESLSLMENSGIKIQIPPPLLVEKFKSAEKKAVDEMIKRGIFNDEVYRNIKEMLAGYREDQVKVEAK